MVFSEVENLELNLDRNGKKGGFLQALINNVYLRTSLYWPQFLSTNSIDYLLYKFKRTKPGPNVPQTTIA